MGKKKKKQAKTTNNPIKKTEDIIREAFRYSNRLVNQREYENPRLRASLDFDSIRVKRRTIALTTTMDDFRSRIVEHLPELGTGFSVENDWAEVNAQPRPAYDAEEEMHVLTLGAAIWMLDQLKECRKLQMVLPLLPLDNGPLDDIKMPNVWDPCHSEELLLGMMSIIQKRNSDCVSKRYNSAETKPDDQLERFFMDLHTAEKSQHQNVDSRNRFETILALIPAEEKKKAVASFTKKFWDWTSRYYQCRYSFALKEAQLDQDYESFYHESANKIRALIKEQKENIPIKPKMSPLMNVAPVIPTSTSIRSLPPINLSEHTRLQAQMETIEKKLDGRKETLEDEISDFWFYLKTLCDRTYEDTVELLGKEIADIWADFTIEDPYEICFGFLLLLDSDSDLPWLYFPGVHLMAWTAAHLPWARFEYEDEVDPIWERWDPYTEQYVTPKEIRSIPKRIKAPDMEDWYRLRYMNQKIDPDCQDQHNLAQIIYEITGGIMPRNLNRYLSALEELDDYGISGKKAIHPLMYCMAFLGEGRRQSKDWRLEIGSVDESLEDAASPETLQEKADQLQREVDQLRRALHEASKESRETKKELESLIQKSAMERQELADLRELVFNQQDDTYSDNKAASDIHFPCHTTQRIVVFGGHDSWAREIKQKLPDVRFVDRTVIPNAQLIRNADIVWIQSNALSHAYFYRIIDEIRKYNIPLRYFSYASATKCAEQIVQQDMQ